MAQYQSPQLEDDFRYLHKRKNIEMREKRAKVRGFRPFQFLHNLILQVFRTRQTMVFLSELTKFGLLPPHAILHCFKVLVDDLTHFNVDSFSLLLEGCGRYTFRNEPTSQKMTALVSANAMPEHQFYVARRYANSPCQPC